MGKITGGQAAQTLLRRRAIRKSLDEWARYKGFQPAPHHALINREIETFLATDDYDVLMLFAPPGSAKSTYVSRLLPSHYLANHPSHSILAATHSVEFAQRWGRLVRNDIALDALVLGVVPRTDNQASDRWSLASGGEYYGVGAGVGIAGYRADLGVIDDPFGSREDAYSEAVRNKRWDWYLNDFSMRLKPRAKRIIMHTRWHDEDIAGRVLQQIDAGIIRGRVISLPAVAEDNDILGRAVGDYLWDEPGLYNYGAFLRQRQKETPAMMWSALFQQRPAPEQGDFWKAEWFIPVETLPDLKIMKVYGASDYATTQDGGDYTVHGVVGIDPLERMYLLDIWRQQASSDVWVEAFCDMVLQYKPLGWAEETGQIKSGVGPWITKRQRARHAWVYREQFPTRFDKNVRAQSMRGRVALSGLHVPIHAAWWPALRAELLSVPAGKYDDQHDMLGLIGQLLDVMTAGQRAKPKHDAPINFSAYKAARYANDRDCFKTY